MRPEPISVVDADGFEVCDDKSRLDFDIIHEFLTNAYWSRGIPRETIKRAADESWCFGLYAPHGSQIGFARLITDYATYAYLADGFVLDAFRGGGLGRWMMETVFSQEATKRLRRITLATRDAHDLYRQVGFEPLHAPEIFMEIVRPDIYLVEGIKL